VTGGPAKPATVRFYFDADVLGLAKKVAELRSDVTYPGDAGGIVHRRRRPPCPVTSTTTLDTVWIAEVARRGWLIITRDSRIQHHRAELAAVRAHDARMVALAGDEAVGTWNQPRSSCADGEQSRLCSASRRRSSTGPREPR
jgi:hypothetical protein